MAARAEHAHDVAMNKNQQSPQSQQVSGARVGGVLTADSRIDLPGSVANDQEEICSARNLNSKKSEQSTKSTSQQKSTKNGSLCTSVAVRAEHAHDVAKNKNEQKSTKATSQQRQHISTWGRVLTADSRIYLPGSVANDQEEI